LARFRDELPPKGLVSKGVQNAERVTLWPGDAHLDIRRLTFMHLLVETVAVAIRDQ
jgi:hypothetical protein